MSKTFKALQRAAKQRIEKSNSGEERAVEEAKIHPLPRSAHLSGSEDASLEDVELKAPGSSPRKEPGSKPANAGGVPAEAGGEASTSGEPPDNGEGTPTPILRSSPAQHPWMPADGASEAVRSGLGGKTDPLLIQILEESLGPSGSSSGIRIERDGWVRGRLDTRRVAALLERFALLHVLKQDARNWYWFWDVKGNALDLARRTGLALDLEEGSERR